MTKEKKNLLAGVFIVIVVYVGTLWQRPMFTPMEFIFAVKSMSVSSELAAVFTGYIGKALKYNIVSVRLLPALGAVICAFCVRIIGRKEYGEKFGNLAAVIFLSTLLVFSYGTACAREMINTMFLCTALTSAYAAFEFDDTRPKYIRYLIAAAGGGAAGLFAASMGVDALIFPFIVIVLYVIFRRPSCFKSVVVTGFVSAVLVLMAWMLNHNISLFSRYGSLKLDNLPYLLYGTLPWVLFLPQAVSGAVKNRKAFFARKPAVFALAVIAAGILVFPVAGILSAAVLVSPFSALLFTLALKESENDEKFLKISERTLGVALIIFVIFAAAVIVSCCIPAVPLKWKLYYSKAELAGFAAACAAAAIQFKIAVDEKSQFKAKKLLHVATGMAVLMILLPGAMPESVKRQRAPEEFFRSSAGRYMARDSVIYADYNSFHAAKWVFRRHKVILINKKNARNIAERIEKGKNTAVFSTSSRFTKLFPRHKILFSRGRWRIVLFQPKGEINE